VDGLARRAYDDPALAKVDKHELIGPTEGAAHDRVRYFRVPPTGRTALERHTHDHNGGRGGGGGNRSLFARSGLGRRGSRTPALPSPRPSGGSGMGSGLVKIVQRPNSYATSARARGVRAALSRARRKQCRSGGVGAAVVRVGPLFAVARADGCRQLARQRWRGSRAAGSACREPGRQLLKDRRAQRQDARCSTRLGCVPMPGNPLEAWTRQHLTSARLDAERPLCDAGRHRRSRRCPRPSAGDGRTRRAHGWPHAPQPPARWAASTTAARPPW
jgi:hypothetical protein